MSVDERSGRGGSSGARHDTAQESQESLESQESQEAMAAGAGHAATHCTRLTSTNTKNKRLNFAVQCSAVQCSILFTRRPFGRERKGRARLGTAEVRSRRRATSADARASHFKNIAANGSQLHSTRTFTTLLQGTARHSTAVGRTGLVARLKCRPLTCEQNQVWLDSTRLELLPPPITSEPLVLFCSVPTEVGSLNHYLITL